MITITKWVGLATNVSPYALPPGAAATQSNLQVLSPGVLSVRGGLASMTWTTHSGSTSPVISMYRYQNGTVETVIYQNASGELHYAAGPA
jgi:hypothetical protein